MRIDLHVRSTEVTESSRSAGSKGAGKKNETTNTPSPAHTDEAKLSFSPARVRQLAQLACSVPDMRKERVAPLKAAVEEGRYEPPAEQVSSAMLSDALARSDLLRR
jgi:flagellar biosynthesis anti-sigma factor FlgM